MPTILRTLDIMTIIQPVFPPCSDPNPTLSTQQAISVTVVLGDKLVSQICQAKSPGCYLRAMGPRAPVSRDHCTSRSDTATLTQSQAVMLSSPIIAPVIWSTDNIDESMTHTVRVCDEPQVETVPSEVAHNAIKQILFALRFNV